MQKLRSPYLQSNRLNDVIAAIQALSSAEDYGKTCDKWSKALSGTTDKADYWRSIFDQHPEFFRPASGGAGNYSLIWRRAQPHVEKATGKIFHDAAYDAATAGLTDQQKRALFGRPQLQDTQVKSLIDIAINLHRNAVDADRDFRWWISPLASLVGTILSATLAFLAAWSFGKR